MFLLLMVLLMSLTTGVWSSECSQLGCIKNMKDLMTNYKCDQLSAIPGKESIFNPSATSVYDNIRAVYYSISIGNITEESTQTRDPAYVEKCCDPSITATCKVYFVYSQSIFYIILPDVLIYLAFLKTPGQGLTSTNNFVHQYCWEPRPFCNFGNFEQIFKDFSEQVITIYPEGEICSSKYVTPERLINSGRAIIYIIPILVFVFSGMLLTGYIARKRKLIRETLTQSSMALYTVRSMMVVSWIIGIALFVQFFQTYQHFQMALDIHPTLNAFREFFSLQVQLGYIQLATFTVVVLVEVPALLVICYKMKNPSKLTSTVLPFIRCDKLSSVPTYALGTFGCIGIVIFVQIQSAALVYMAIFCFYYPLYSIMDLTKRFTVIVMSMFLLVLIQKGVIDCGKCRCSSGTVLNTSIIFIAWMITALVLLVFFDAYHTPPQTSFNTGIILNSLFSSTILAAMGYIFKNVIYQKVKKEVNTAKSDPERQPLVETYED